MNPSAYAFFAIVLYLAATARLAAGVFRVELDTPALKGQVLAVGLVAVILHGISLYLETVTAAGVNLGFFNALSLVTWVIVLLLLAELMNRPIESLGLVVFPLAVLALGLDIGFQSEHLLPTERGFGFQLHVLLAIVAYSVLSIAALQALMLAVQERAIRRKHPGRVMRVLPPLQTMEGLLFQMIALGFFLLSLAIVSGIMFLEDMFAQHVAHKTVLSIIAWLIFAVLLWGRWRFGWRGRTAIRWSLVGFVVLMLAFFGSKLVLELVLQR